MVYIILILLLHTANLSVTADIVTKVPVKLQFILGISLRF